MSLIFFIKINPELGRNGGLCHSFGLSYDCQCPLGFSGKNCEQQDICGTKNPCVCGTCQNDPNISTGYICFCPAGYTGQRCERGYF